MQLYDYGKHIFFWEGFCHLVGHIPHDQLSVDKMYEILKGERAEISQIEVRQNLIACRLDPHLISMVYLYNSRISSTRTRE